MKLFSAESWLRAPLDRDVIARWTVGPPQSSHALALPQPEEPDKFVFLALGDTGDSEAAGTRLSPQDAVAREMAADAMVPDSRGCGELVLHTGDVVYMTGERRLYERNFRRPYAPFLTPDSTADSLTFRLPFLPVPGNHDYYDVGGWAKWIARIPLLRFGVRAATARLFAFRLPEGGSGQGAAYMHAFVDPRADTSTAPFEYAPGTRTRLPNRYYRFTYGCADFFGLDSNTLEAPAPWRDTAKVRADAASHIEALEAREETLEKLLKRAQKAVNDWTDAARAIATEDTAAQKQITLADTEIARTLKSLRTILEEPGVRDSGCADPRLAVTVAERRWAEACEEWGRAASRDERRKALETLEAAGEEVCAAVSAAESCLGTMPESDVKSRLQRLRDQLEQELTQWDRKTTQTPPELGATVTSLSEEILDVQRELALERRRLRYLPDDYDKGQLEWLDRALSESVSARPNQWRIVFLHHPLYTTTSNHCEAPDVIGLRENLLEILKDRVDLIISGHAHAFEWFRSDRLPNTGIFVTGGGGQVSLRPSLLAERRFGSRRARYDSLRESGVTECAMAGEGPDAPDGEDGRIYHYLRIETSRDQIRVVPVGVRRLDRGFRREAPLPTFHAPSLPPRRPTWNARMLHSVTVRRGQPPEPQWG